MAANNREYRFDVPKKICIFVPFSKDDKFYPAHIY